MAFSDFVYESDLTVSFQIRIDSDQATAAGGVAGSSDIPAHVRVSSGRRQFGVLPRYITASRVVGTAPDTFNRVTKLPICTPARFAAIAVGSAITINGLDYVVSGKTPETYR